MRDIFAHHCWEFTFIFRILSYTFRSLTLAKIVYHQFIPPPTKYKYLPYKSSLQICCNFLSVPGTYRDKTMADKLIYIPNNNTQNYPFCRLKLVFETFKHSTQYHYIPNNNTQNYPFCRLMLVVETFFNTQLNIITSPIIIHKINPSHMA